MAHRASTVKISLFRSAGTAPILPSPKGGAGVRDGWGHNKERGSDGVLMTYTFKLSRRLARFRGVVGTATCVLALACAGDPSAPETPTNQPSGLQISPDPVSVGVNQSVQFSVAADSGTSLSLARAGRGRGHNRIGIVSLSVSPDKVTLATNASSRFSVLATMSDGSVQAPAVTWSASGGTVDSTGLFTAGAIPGNYVAIARASNGMADTAAVSVTTDALAPILVSLSPTSVTLPEGATKQFSVVGRTSDSTTVAVSPRYTATGGTVTAAGVYTAGKTAGSFRIVATDTTTGLADTSAVTITAPTLAAVALSPSSVTLAPGDSQQFTASGTMSDGSTGPVSVTYAAGGGTISSAGQYVAGITVGTYRIIATQSGGALADTATVTISAPPPTLQSVVLTPSTASVTSGSTQQFAVTGKMSDGSTTPINATYSATGGSITSAGLYTAGTTAGSFRVIATQQGGTMADTAAITVATSSPTPQGNCARAVNVSSVSGLSAAVGSAQPGDCINVAPGTYSLSTALRITRSGTASQPITIQGDGSTTVINLQQQEMTFEKASYVRLRKLRLTNFPLRGFWLRDSHYNVLDSLEIDHTQHEAIALKDLSSHNTIQNSRIHDTGLAAAEYGEGVYVGGSADAGYQANYGVTDNKVLDNKFGPNVRSESVDVKQGGDRTLIDGNSFDGTGTANTYTAGSASLVAVIASYVTINANTFTYGRPNGVIFYAPSDGSPIVGNVASNNRIDLQNILNYSGDSFYGFNLTRGTNSTDHVVIKCSNTVTNGAFSNVACTP